MLDIQIVALEPQDPRIENFRQRVLLEDLSVSPTDCDSLIYRSEFDTAFKGHPEPEDVYKFSRRKWNQVEFTKVLAFFDQDEIVSIAGCKLYAERFLRIGMYYYTLKSMRKKHRSLLWRQNGFFDEATNLFPEAQGYFVTIYPHNRRLKAWTERLRRGRRFSQLGNRETGVVDRLRRFQVMPELVNFNNVPQLVMYSQKKGGEIPKDFLLSILGSKA